MWGMIANLIGGPIVKGLLNAYKSKLTADNVTDRLAADLALKDIDARIERTRARKELGLMAMTHPVWWFAWCMFVIPVGLYHAMIFMLSTFGIPPCTAEIVEGCFTVLKVPSDQAETARIIVRNIFFAQGGLGLAGLLIKRFERR
jgi:hypothetical protein